MKQEVILALNEYNHSRPIIFSHIEKQYACEVFYDETEQYGILFTNFDYHFTFGNIPNNDNNFLQVIKDYKDKHKKKEIILFAPNAKWNVFLKVVFSKINGVVDKRNLYYINKDTFNQFDTTNTFIKIELVNDEDSLIAYPQANVYINGNLVSYCRAFMLGNKQAELDVWTHKRYRKKGFAFDTSLSLIEYLLKNNINPNWSCWANKKSSNTLAKKLGFELEMEITTFVWVADFGDF